MSGSLDSRMAKDASPSRSCETTCAASAGKSSIEFSVTQAAGSRGALELFLERFGCGTIIPNRRHDNHTETMLRFSVKRRSDLVMTMIPFFGDHPLKTAKLADFDRFRTVLQIMEQGRHLESSGLAEIAAITETMNRRQRSRYLESSEAIRRPTHIELS